MKNTSCIPKGNYIIRIHFEFLCCICDAFIHLYIELVHLQTEIIPDFLLTLTDLMSLSGLAESWRTWTVWQVSVNTKDFCSDKTRTSTRSNTHDSFLLLFLPVLISYSYTYNPELKRSPLSIVTALVDKIGERLQHVGMIRPTVCFVWLWDRFSFVAQTWGSTSSIPTVTSSSRVVWRGWGRRQLKQRCTCHR